MTTGRLKKDLKYNKKGKIDQKASKIAKKIKI